MLKLVLNTISQEPSHPSSLNNINSNNMDPSHYDRKVPELEHSTSPKKVRLPSILNIAQNIPSSQKQIVVEQPIDNLQVAAEIFTSTDKLSTNEHQQQYPPAHANENFQYFSPQQPLLPHLTPQQQQQQPIQMIPSGQFRQYHESPQVVHTQYYYAPVGPPQADFPHYDQHPPIVVHNDTRSKSLSNPSSLPKRGKVRSGELFLCERCGTGETPEWRKGPHGARTLCNACGLFYAKILKRDGAEAAANAIFQRKVLKRKTPDALPTYITTPSFEVPPDQRPRLHDPAHYQQHLYQQQQQQYVLGPNVQHHPQHHQPQQYQQLHPQHQQLHPQYQPPGVLPPGYPGSQLIPVGVPGSTQQVHYSSFSQPQTSPPLQKRNNASSF